MKLQTAARSLVMRVLGSRRMQVTRQRLGRLRRLTRKAEPVVHYFHQVDDPYSHLAVQRLAALRDKYRVRFEPHLTSAEEDAFRGDAERYPLWSLRDAQAIAEGYGVTFPAVDEFPPELARVAANNQLADKLSGPDFEAAAQAVGEAYWAGKSTAASTTPTATHALVSGNRLREQLGHYAGGMFYFEGEWYWGLDRLYLLEARLIAEGFGEPPLVVPRPSPTAAGTVDASQVVLEYFPSLRSPYTAMSFERTLALAARMGVHLDIRPVMPMMMRGVPAPRRKQLYIIRDAAREARAAGVPFGKIVDPFGDPVKRAFALLPWVIEQGRLSEFVGAYLRAAWAEGVDVTSEAGLAQVVTTAGLSWSDAVPHLGDTAAAEHLLDANVNDMLAAGLWGVPSFRVSGGVLAGSYSCWGQDRLWRVEAEIIARGGARVDWANRESEI